MQIKGSKYTIFSSYHVQLGILTTLILYTFPTWDTNLTSAYTTIEICFG
jgi:hypothetical protein